MHAISLVQFLFVWCTLRLAGNLPEHNLAGALDSGRQQLTGAVLLTARNPDAFGAAT